MIKSVAVTEGKVLVRLTEGVAELPDGMLSSGSEGEVYEYRYGEDTYRAFGIDEESIPEGYSAEGIRELWGLLSERDFDAVGKGAELVFWDCNTRYCGKCGAAMSREGDIRKVCTGCGREAFPAVSPAIIVLVSKGDEALLVHARTFRKPFYGLVAGFVETGESLEECVVREVEEETSLRIRNVRYFGSQPWPYPSQLMIGFTAEYEGGNLKFADGELTDGGFFRRDNLPLLPGKPSIARRLIEAWISGEIGKNG